jgi:hypothetical protein
MSQLSLSGTLDNGSVPECVVRVYDTIKDYIHSLVQVSTKLAARLAYLVYAHRELKRSEIAPIYSKLTATSRVFLRPQLLHT